VEEHINTTRPWDFFDGASKDDGVLCGGGGILHLSPTHSFKLKWGLGQGTNNYAELMAFKAPAHFCWGKRILDLQIFGDSMVVINWMRKTQKCHNIILASLLEEVFLITDIFTNLSFKHVYRERNGEADSLSKEGTSMAHGQWHIIELLDGQSQEHYHRPFIEQPTQLYKGFFIHFFVYKKESTSAQESIATVFLNKVS
jgi:ribonuclease HI